MTDEELIREYRKLRNIGDICREKGLDQSNILQATASKEKKHIVAKEITIEIMKMYGIVMLYQGDANVK